ncbi:hypothetical protein INT43_005148 [Umbelopsis isabellina]|uniref:Uncharacterized protein n=1 Tax=Mortierella isabellina TaxID=91625 RepID=A0A8H7PH37_MORIS|nr:hypothetical protein INT43_005148 [Umbelopsis isabellina]
MTTLSFRKRPQAKAETTMSYETMTHDLSNIPTNGQFTQLHDELSQFLSQENLDIPNITTANITQSKDPKAVVEHMKAENQATREQRQDTRAAANALLQTIHDLEAEQEPVRAAAGQIRQIEQHVQQSSDLLRSTEKDMP